MTERHIHNIALVGFMGTGKTSVGRALATMLRFDFWDTDDLVERRAGKSISAIFADDGEPAFRKLECEVLEAVGAMQRAVIATGGGLITHSDNLARLKACALVACLWASPDAIWNRVRQQSHRPLLNTHDPVHRIRELLNQRQGFYRQADILINAEVRSIRQVAQQIEHQFRIMQGQQNSREGTDPKARRGP